MSDETPATHTDTLTIRIRALAELFSPPQRDPWRDGPELPRSGIEQALALFRNKHLRNHATRLVIKVDNLPAPDAALAARAPEAWKNTCIALAREAAASASHQRHTGWSALLRLAPTIIIALGLSAFFDQVQPLPQLVNRLFSEGFIVLGWVMLWRPIEILLFDASQPALQKILFEKLSRLHVSVET